LNTRNHFGSRFPLQVLACQRTNANAAAAGFPLQSGLVSDASLRRKILFRLIVSKL